MGTVGCEEHCAREKNRKVHWQEELFFMAGFTATPRAKMVTRNGRNEETVHGMDATTRKVTATPRDKIGRAHV